VDYFGWPELDRVGRKAGVSKGHLSHIVHGWRRPSAETADRLIAASDGRLSFDRLMRAPRREGS
jgi:plasmid maintenance system antidote protein VapI